MSDTSNDILAAARNWLWKYGRRGGSRRDRDAAEMEDGAGSDGSQDYGTQRLKCLGWQMILCDSTIT